METFITLWHFCGAQQRVCNYCKVLKAQHAVWEQKKKQRGTFYGNKSADLHKTQNNSAGTPKNFSTFCYSSVVFVSKSLNLPLPFCSPDYPKIDRVKKKKDSATWKLTSPIVTVCPPQQRAESEKTALTRTVPKPQCAYLNPTET